MAYVSQQLKKELQPAIMAICKKYGIKASLAVRNHSTLCLNIKSGPIDFITPWNKFTKDRQERNGLKFYESKSIDLPSQGIAKGIFTGQAAEFVDEIYPAMDKGNWDKSDIMTDYFNVGWYVDINIGQWDKPYVLEASK